MNGDVVRRTVWAPPWSTRPPDIEPEPWMHLLPRNQQAARDEWKARDPEGFAAQEARRKAHEELKKQGKSSRYATPALPKLPFIGYELPKISAAAARPSTTTPAADTSCTIMSDNVDDLHDQAMYAIKYGAKELLVEVCCSETSQLSEHLPPGCVAIRVTQANDMTKANTLKVLKNIVHKARKAKVRVSAWISIPCTAGCRWRYVNDSLGIPTGDPQLTEALIRNCTKLAKYCTDRGADFTWEWPSTSELWQDGRVHHLLADAGGGFASVAASAVGQCHTMNDETVWTRKSWLLYTTCPVVQAAFSRYSSDPDADSKTFTWCRGRIAKESAEYPEQFAKIFWSARRASRMARDRRHALAARPAHHPHDDFGDHREHDTGPPRQPLWCALVTRVVKPKSK